MTTATVHVLSKKSSELRRDTFIFRPSKPAKLFVALNQKTTPVTSAKLYRWIRLLEPELDDFDLRPVAIAKRGVLTYYATPTGPPISSESTHSLPPGDYGWFISDYDSLPFLEMESDLSFEGALKYAKQDRLANWDDVFKLYVFPSSFEQSVLLRDTHCFITGEEASQTNPNLGVSWIVPPAWIFKLIFPRTPRDSDFTPFISISNVGAMRKDLITLFHDNAFGVDVDDDYRIVVFRDLGSVTLPSNQNRAQACVGPDDRFLREHFRWCLRVHLLGGDIREDYNFRDIAKAAEELGLCGDEPVMALLDDERWHSTLGKELLEDHISTELYARASESDED